MIGRSAGMRSQEQVKNISETNRQLLRVNARKSCLFLFAQVFLVIPIRVSQFLGIRKTAFLNALQSAPAIVLHWSIFVSFLPLPRPRSQVSISGRSCPTPIYQGFAGPSACPAPAAWLRADRQRRAPLDGEKEGCMKQSKANLGTVRHRPPLSYCAVLCR